MKKYLLLTVLMSSCYLPYGVDVNPVPCSTEYAPVCSFSGKEYRNACEAKKAGVELFEKGKCNSILTP